MSIPPFHLAFPVHDLQKARQFYGEVLGFPEGRSTATWIDFNCYGHQIVAHLHPQLQLTKIHNPVDGDEVPVPHFGVVLKWQDWQALANRLQQADISFVIEPRIRFQGEVGEQGTFFLYDPSGNALEFKSFQDMSQLFAT